MAERGNNLISRSEAYGFNSTAFGFDSRAEESPSDSLTTNTWNLLSIVGEMPTSKRGENVALAAPETPMAKPVEARAAEGEKHQRHKHESTAKADLKKELPDVKNLRDGDIVFVSNGAFDEGKAIQMVSKSPLTHCGVLFKEGDDWVVYEAVQPVKKTPLKEFHKTDSGETYAVRRLKNADEVLTKDSLEKLHSALKKNEGKDYDHLFGWGNDKMYCSELVWKAYYEATKLKVGKIQMVGDYDLSDPLVKKLVEQRYGKDVPVTDPTITPGAVFDSRLLKTIK
jgi:hypothetical protein